MGSTAKREPARSGQFIVQYVPSEDGYVALIIERPGIMSQGETPREALRNVLEAMFEAEDVRG